MLKNLLDVTIDLFPIKRNGFSERTISQHKIPFYCEKKDSDKHFTNLNNQPESRPGFPHGLCIQSVQNVLLEIQERKKKTPYSFYVRKERLICYLWSMCGKNWVTQKITEAPERSDKDIRNQGSSIWARGKKRKEMKTSDSKGTGYMGPLGY